MRPGLFRARERLLKSEEAQKDRRPRDVAPSSGATAKHARRGRAGGGGEEISPSEQTPRSRRICSSREKPRQLKIAGHHRRRSWTRSKLRHSRRDNELRPRNIIYAGRMPSPHKELFVRAGKKTEETHFTLVRGPITMARAKRLRDSRAF